MKRKKYKIGMTFFVTEEVYQNVRKISDEKEISQSKILRLAVDELLARSLDQQAKNETQEVDDGRE